MTVKRVLAGLITAGVVVFFVLPAIFNDEGDWLGPLERTARAVLNGWDMWATAGVRPYETPMPARPDGIVPTAGRAGFPMAQALLASRDAAAILTDGQRAYQRYCRHCHGPNGDGRTIVGESFGVVLPDLRSETVQQQSDRALFEKVAAGSANMIPLRETLAPEDLLAALRHVRTLKGAPSVPFFRRKSVGRGH